MLKELNAPTGVMVLEQECGMCATSFIGTWEDEACPECRGEAPAFMVRVRRRLYIGEDMHACHTTTEMVLGVEALENLLVECGEEGHEIIWQKQVYYI